MADSPSFEASIEPSPESEMPRLTGPAQALGAIRDRFPVDLPDGLVWTGVVDSLEVAVATPTPDNLRVAHERLEEALRQENWLDDE